MGKERSTRNDDRPAAPIVRPLNWSSYLDEGPVASEDFMQKVEDLPTQERKPGACFSVLTLVQLNAHSNS